MAEEEVVMWAMRDIVVNIYESLRRYSRLSPYIHAGQFQSLEAMTEISEIPGGDDGKFVPINIYDIVIYG